MRLTIDYGIDLGTTNSAIALNISGTPQLLKGGEGEPILPSIVHLTANGTFIVGAAARPFLDSDPNNTQTEFKRLMGTKEGKYFPASGKTYQPEELSAEILKELVYRAQTLDDKPIKAAVITIPAMFQLPQSSATQRAAHLAGIEHAILLAEPIAAAVAHASITTKNEGYWLVYDLGGGTFDVSLVRSRKGQLQVLDHDGDNHLGGKDLDRLVVNTWANHIRQQTNLTDFKRSNFKSAFAKLKIEAESARLRLSEVEETQVRVDKLLDNDSFHFEIPFSRTQLEETIHPELMRTVELCQTILRRNSLKAYELNGIVLVGGPTLTPYLPTLLQAKIGAEARHVMNPLCIVAFGAAIYASTQKIPETLRQKQNQHNQIDIQLSFESMTTNPRPLVTGKTHKLNTERTVNDAAAVRIIRNDGGFDSGLINLMNDSAFALLLNLKEKALNVFKIQVFDTIQQELTANIHEFTILHGLSVSAPPLPESVGIMLANDTVTWYINKGTPLPAEKTAVHHTTTTLEKGHSGVAIHVPLLQGSNSRPDRNKLIGVLHIQAENIRHILPAGSEVQVTLSVDAHSQTIARAYVPVLDQWFDNIVNFDLEVKEPEEIQKALSQEINRMEELKKMAEQLNKSPDEMTEVGEKLKHLSILMDDLDSDDTQKMDSLIKNIAVGIDNMEEGNRMDVARDDFNTTIEQIDDILEFGATDSHRQLFKALKQEVNAAQKVGNLKVVEAKTKQLQELENDIILTGPYRFLYIFGALKSICSDKNLGQSLIRQGDKAISEGDTGALQNICAKLFELLPEIERGGLMSEGTLPQSGIE